MRGGFVTIFGEAGVSLLNTITMQCHQRNALPWRRNQKAEISSGSSLASAAAKAAANAAG